MFLPPLCSSKNIWFIFVPFSLGYRLLEVKDYVLIHFESSELDIQQVFEKYLLNECHLALMSHSVHKIHSNQSLKQVNFVFFFVCLDFLMGIY